MSGNKREGLPDGSALLGVTEIAQRLKVKPNTVSIWRYRHPTFPAPIVVLSMGPIWWADDVDSWAAARNPRRIGPANH